MFVRVACVALLALVAAGEPCENCEADEIHLLQAKSEEDPKNPKLVATEGKGEKGPDFSKIMDAAREAVKSGMTKVTSQMSEIVVQMNEFSTEAEVAFNKSLDDYKKLASKAEDASQNLTKFKALVKDTIAEYVPFYSGAVGQVNAAVKAAQMVVKTMGKKDLEEKLQDVNKTVTTKLNALAQSSSEFSSAVAKSTLEEASVRLQLQQLQDICRTFANARKLELRAKFEESINSTVREHFGSIVGPNKAARPEDVCQGALGNCWFAGALSVVAQLPQLIDCICVTKELNPNGVYHLRLCHAGQWLDLAVDDLFPTSQVSEGQVDGRLVSFSRGGNLCYLGGARRQLWPPLVEKAAAKLFGCYGALKGGTFAEALALFTGYPTQKLRLYIPKLQRAERAQRRQAQQERRTELLLRGQGVPEDQSDDSDDDDLNWSKLVSCKDAGYLLGLGCSEEACEKSKHHIVEEMGLQAPHAYGILDLAEVVVDGKTEHLVKIRDPWGQNAPRTWKGKWSKDWDGWTPELRKELKVINSSGVLMDDPMSIFWMAFEDVKEYFAQVEICRVHQDWHEVREKAWLPSLLGPGQAFDLSLRERSNVDIAFWQERHSTREGALGATCTNVDVGLVILRRRGADGYDVVDAAPRAFEDCVSVEVILEGGFDYCVVPISLQRLESEPRQGILAVHSVKPVFVQRQSSSWRQVACALCCTVQHRGRSWSHHFNPAIRYWHFFEPGGCCFMVENGSPDAIAIQADGSESIGCSSSRGEMGAVVKVPAFSRRMVMALTFSLDLGWASANIQPQKVPLDMVPAADPAASDNVHMPIPLASAWAALAPRAPSIRNQDEDEHDLAEAIRLSLTPAPAPAVSERPKSGKEQLEKRTKDLFELYRSQGVAPHEAAQRAAAQARRETAG